MKFVSLFTMSGKAILIAARFPNVVASGLTALFTFKSLDKLLNSEMIKWLVLITITTTPQFVFLSSYFNCDAPAILGSSMICYSWAYIFKKRIDVRISVLLAVGISIVTLSYYNAYGWILLSIILFLSRAIPLKKGDHIKDRKGIWICGLAVTIIVLLLCGYFVVRNYVIYDGDILGISTLENSGELYAADELKPSIHQTPYRSGQSMAEMIFTTDWIPVTVISCLGCFGYMMFGCPAWVYLIYTLVLIVGYGFFIAETTVITIKKRKERSAALFFRYLCIFAALIPVYLSLHYSFYTDYQPQGRYIYPALPAAAVLLGLGYDCLYKTLKDRVKIPVKVINTIVLMLTIGMMATSLYVFKEVYLPSSWGSMEIFLQAFPAFD